MAKNTTKTETPKLGKVKIRLLSAMAKAKKPLTGSELAEKAEVDPTAIGNQVGYRDESINKRAVHKHNLVNRGYAKIEWDEKESGAQFATYVITAAGKKALESAKE